MERRIQTSILSNILIVLCLLTLPARSQEPLQGVPWDGKPMKRTLGINNGLPKILLEIQGKKGIRPTLNLMFRDTDRSLHDKVFRHVPALTPDRLTYMGSKEINADGNQWLQRRFTNGMTDVLLCTSLKSIGPKYATHFTKIGLVFDQKRLPFALLLLRNEQSDTPYFLRDISAFANPGKALLDDEIPIEAGVSWEQVMLYYQQRLEHKDPKIIMDGLRCLFNIPGARMRLVISRLLHLRQSKNAQIAELSQQLCQLNGFYSEADVTRAINALDDPDENVVRRNVLFLRDRGLDAKRRSIPAFEKLLRTRKLSEKLQQLTTRALQKLRGLKRTR